MRRARILDWVRMHRSHDRYNDVEPSSPPQSSPDYTIVIRGYNFREGQDSTPRSSRQRGRIEKRHILTDAFTVSRTRPAHLIRYARSREPHELSECAFALVCA